MQRFDAIVVGAGVMGAATARALSKRGASVCLLEQFFIGHDNGSSHGSSRVFRFSYPDPLYVTMAQQAKVLWRELEAESGESLLLGDGGLDLGPDIEANAAALEECAAEYEQLTGAAVAERWPTLSVPPEQPALFQPDGGYVAADLAVETFVASAVRAGCALRERTQAVVMEPALDGVIVTTDDDIIGASVVIVTAGAWAGELLGRAGIDLPVKVTRETVAYFKIDGDVPPLVEWGEPTKYALPAPGEGLKAAEHIAGPVTDPHEPGSVDEASVERIAAWVGERFPSADPKPLRAETCLYTNTIDEHFILERHGPLVIGSPCSGHGFKFAPFIGEHLADLAFPRSRL